MRVKGIHLVALIGLFFGLIISCTKNVNSKPSYIFKAAPNQTAAAKVGSITISKDQLYKGIETDLYEKEKELYDIKFNKLKSLILQSLIDNDPRRKNVKSNDEFLQKYISSKVEVSDADVQAFIKERKIPKQHINEQIKGKVREYLKVEKRKQAIDNWLKSKLAESPAEIYLTKPKRPVFDVKVGKSPRWGKADAKVTVVEFSDFQCPYCKKGAEVIDKLKKKYGKKISVVFKHFPLPFHKDAPLAAQASLCANEKGKFWKMHDALFADQTSLKKPQLIDTAARNGLKRDSFTTCLSSGKFKALVDQDVAEGRRVNVKSTPTFFVNGKLVNGAQPLEVFSELIDQELAK